MHTAKLYTQGGSIALTIPRSLLNSMGLSSGAQVTIATDGKQLVISPVRKKYSLNELVAGMKAGDLPRDAEWETAPAVGNEAI
jgi:antitoxin component of MazEF toxin-antitoxin module